MTNKRLYAEISKTEAMPDGTVKVWGYASSESMDSDGETITASAMKAALPDYMKFGAVREMHQAKAAGTAIEARVEDDGRTWFGAHVVDSEAVKKVGAGVYKGFSIGGKVTSREALNKAVITGLNLVEVSLVDRPANPDAVFTCFKADGITKGMYDVSRFAEVLQSLAYLAISSKEESVWEGDTSPVPALLREWLSQGAAIFQAMAKEEVEEMMGVLAVAEKSDGGNDLEKRGAKYSTATKAALKAAHDACKAADKALADLGYDGADEEVDDTSSQKAAVIQSAPQPNADAPPASDPVDDTAKAATGDDLAKALTVATADIQKLQAERDDAIQKVADQAKRIAELEAQPEAPKGVLQAIGKAQDTGGNDAPEEAAPTSPRDAIRKAHQAGGYRLS